MKAPVRWGPTAVGSKSDRRGPRRACPGITPHDHVCQHPASPPTFSVSRRPKLQRAKRAAARPDGDGLCDPSERWLVGVFGKDIPVDARQSDKENGAGQIGPPKRPVRQAKSDLVVRHSKADSVQVSAQVAQDKNRKNHGETSGHGVQRPGSAVCGLGWHVARSIWGGDCDNSIAQPVHIVNGTLARVFRSAENPLR